MIEKDYDGTCRAKCTPFTVSQSCNKKDVCEWNSSTNTCGYKSSTNNDRCKSLKERHACDAQRDNEPYGCVWINDENKDTVDNVPKPKARAPWKTSNVKNYTVYVGDERTIDMCLNDVDCKDPKKPKDGNIKVVATDGADYNWFISSGIKQIISAKKELRNSVNIVILLGANDVEKDGTQVALKYMQKLDSLTEKNGQFTYDNIVFVSAVAVIDGTPVYNNPQKKIYNLGIDSFNKTIKEEINKINAKKGELITGLKFCDYNSKIKSVFIDFKTDYIQASSGRINYISLGITTFSSVKYECLNKNS